MAAVAAGEAEPARSGGVALAASALDDACGDCDAVDVVGDPDGMYAEDPMPVRYGERKSGDSESWTCWWY